MEYEYKEPQKLKLKKINLDTTQDFHKIHCPSCQHEIRAIDLNINDKIAKCGECNVVFSFQETVNQLSVSSKKNTQLIVRPEGIGQFNFKDELGFALQQPYGVIEGIVGMLGILLALLCTVVALKKGGLGPMLGTVFFWGISAYPIYSWITHKKNKIYLNVNQQFLKVEWHPKKMNKDQSYENKNIDQLYIKINPATGLFDLYMIYNGLDGQKHVCLVPSLDSKTKARYLEQEIEKYLGIEDREVLEEVKI